MTEEQLVLGRPPRPPRRGPWGGRAPRLALAVALAAVGGWAVWHALSARPASPPGDTASTRAPVPTAPGLIAYDPPQVPYLRGGVLVSPDEPARALPAQPWTDLAELTDGTIVLVADESLTVIWPGGERATHRHTGGISARPDGTAVAWTDPDGRVRQLQAHRPQAFAVAGARQLSPACRGIRLHGRDEPGWEVCDRDGGLTSPGGTFFASLGATSVTVAPRADITGGVSAAFLGRVTDAVWEDAHHLLVVVSHAEESHLERVGTDGETEDLIPPPHGAYDGDRPLLVLPATTVQP